MSRLREAILARKSLLLYGPADSGKTALLNETLSGLADNVRKNCLVCRSSESPKRIWRNLTYLLGEGNDPQVVTRVKHECGSPASLARWVDKQTSVRLRGILRSAMRVGNYCVFIDAPGPLPVGAYRLLQEWIWSGRTPVFLLSRGARGHELGKATRLYWHKGMQLELAPLHAEDAETLFEQCITRFRLRQIVDVEFRNFVLNRCEGLPGRIVRLCELASQSPYQSGGHIKLHTLAVDFLMHAEAVSGTAPRARQHG